MDVPLELEQWKKSIFACWGLKNEHTKNPPDIEVKHSTLNWEFGDSSISFLKSYHHKTCSSAKKSTQTSRNGATLAANRSCKWWAFALDGEWTDLRSCKLQLLALSHVYMCKKAEAKEKVEQKATLQGLFREGCQLKSAIQNPSLVDPKHSSLFFLVRVSCAQLLQVSGGGTYNIIWKILTYYMACPFGISFTQDAAGGNKIVHEMSIFGIQKNDPKRWGKKNLPKGKRTVVYDI